MNASMQPELFAILKTFKRLRKKQKIKGVKTANKTLLFTSKKQKILQARSNKKVECQGKNSSALHKKSKVQKITFFYFVLDTLARASVMFAGVILLSSVKTCCKFLIAGCTTEVGISTTIFLNDTIVSFTCFLSD